VSYKFVFVSGDALQEYLTYSPVSTLTSPVYVTQPYNSFLRPYGHYLAMDLGYSSCRRVARCGHSGVIWSTVDMCSYAY